MAELDRIVQRCDATREMSEIWMETVPKIIAVANEENNPHLRVLCDDAKGPISEGIYSLHIVAKCFYSMHAYSFQIYSGHNDASLPATRHENSG